MYYIYVNDNNKSFVVSNIRKNKLYLKNITNEIITISKHELNNILYDLNSKSYTCLTEKDFHNYIKYSYC